jgi:hypothetical protein
VTGYLRVDEVLAIERGPAPALRVARTFPPVEPALAGPGGPDGVPAGLVLELMATAGGALVADWVGGGHLPLLLQVEDCEFAAGCRRGERLVAAATLEGPPAAGPTPVARARVEVSTGDRRVAAGRFLYVCVPAGTAPALGSGLAAAGGPPGTSEGGASARPVGPAEAPGGSEPGP